MYHSEMIKHKVYLLPKYCDQLSGWNISFVLVTLFLIATNSNQLFFENLFSIAAIVFHHFGLIKSQLEHKALYQLLQILVFYSNNIRLLWYILQTKLKKILINGISRVLQKLLKYFNDTIIFCLTCYFLFIIKWSIIRIMRNVNNSAIVYKWLISVVLP